MEIYYMHVQNKRIIIYTICARNTIQLHSYIITNLFIATIMRKFENCLQDIQDLYKNVINCFSRLVI